MAVCSAWILSVLLVLATPSAGISQGNGFPQAPSSAQTPEPLGFDLRAGRFASAAFESPDMAASRLPPTWDATTASRNPAMEIVQRRDSYAVRRYRQGFFQRLRFTGSWINRARDDGLGISTLDTSLTVAVPLGSFENLLLVTPGFDVDYLSGPNQVDTPPRLYNVGVDLMWRKQFNERWGGMVAVRPGVASDFQTSQDALRITGRALATWQYVPERLSLLFGVVYLDRNDLPILPGVGLIWTPSPDWRLDLIFPRPRLAHRLAFWPQQREDWVYLGGSLGGRTWAVERASGDSDQLTLRDYRLFIGWERIVDGGSGLFIEAGCVLGRKLEYEQVPQTLSFDNAVLIRGGVTY